MRRLLPVFILAAAFTNCKTASNDEESDLLFYGSDNQSATMSYASFVEIKLPAGVRSPNDLLTGTNRRKMQEIVDYQAQHLFGVFSVHPEYVKNPGILSSQSKPKITTAEINASARTAKVNYTLFDTGVFKKKLLVDGPRKIQFVLPKDPTTIYAKGIPPGQSVNKCTDDHYNSEDDFWYFWNPKKFGCPITEADLVAVEAQLTPIASTIKSHPYYDKILGDNGNGRKLRIVYLVGVDQDFNSGDLGRKTFNEALDLLKEKGFETDSSKSSRFAKLLTLKKRDWDVELQVKLVDPGTQEFVADAAAAMENDDVFIYDGHSGLGGYLNLKRLQQSLGRPLKLDVNKSQIFFFNGCSTFAYYNHDYFELKKTSADPKGIKNLDIVSTAIGASFDIGARHDVILIAGIADGSRPSWKLLIDRMYRVDREQTALTHVNGDEDNPTAPR